MERVVIDVANGLDRSQFEQAVCCLSRRGEAAGLLREGVRCLDLGKGETADHLMPLKLARVIRAERPDIVHTQSWSGIDAAIARLIICNPRLVHSEHGRNWPNLDFEPLKRRVARRCLYQLADAVFAISNEVRDYYCRETRFPRERMRVIPNGIDVRRIDEADGTGVREELGIGADDFVVGTVARLDATKDTITLARAFSKLRVSPSPSKPKLLVIGDGDQRVAIEGFVAEQGLRGAAILTGVRHDVPRLLGAMDVFALSSLSEGMPITVLEAMAARLPVVATNVGALPEMIVEGVTGFLVEAKDDQALAERLAKLRSDRDLAKRFGAEARRKVESEYNLDLMLRRYADLYRLIKHSPQNPKRG
jgi:sugar transferase (PEP-CTERM/EpsH1 system associated)